MSKARDTPPLKSNPQHLLYRQYCWIRAFVLAFRGLGPAEYVELPSALLQDGRRTPTQITSSTAVSRRCEYGTEAGERVANDKRPARAEDEATVKSEAENRLLRPAERARSNEASLGADRHIGNGG